MLAAAQVRQQVASRLASVAITAGRVFEGRYHPVTEADTPCWFVSIDVEDCESQSHGWPALIQHRLRIEASAFLLETDALEAQLDTAQAQGLAALFTTSPPWQLRCLGTRRTVHDAEGADARAGRLTLFLEATFLTEENAPETLIP